MPVNETPAVAKPHAGVKPRRRRWRRRVLGLLAGAAVVLAAGWFVALPWLLRSRVQAALRAAGVRDVTFDVATASPWGSALKNVEAGDGSALEIERISLDYSPLDLWNGEIHALRIRGGRVELRVRDGKVDLSPLAAFVFGRDRPTEKQQSQDQPPSAAADPASLPVNRIELIDSSLVLRTDGGTLEIPIDATVANRAADRLLVEAHAGPEKELQFGAQIDLVASNGTFEGSADPGWTLLTIQSIWPGAKVAVDGKLKLSGRAAWGDRTGGSIRLEVAEAAAGSAAAAGNAKLRVGKGVLEVSGQLGADAHAKLDVRDAALSMPDAGVTGEGVSGSVTLTGFTLPNTPPSQRFVASKLEIGGLTLTDGSLEFQVADGTQIHVQHTRWHAFGGSVWADEFTVSAAGGEPIRATLHAQEISLKDLLATFAKDKASGEGTISGELPVVIDGSDVQFGEGQLASLRGGNVQIKDVAAIAPVAEGAAASAQSPSQSEQIKRNIIDALGDFQYDRLNARLATDPDGRTSAYVRMSGRGRAGARQALDYDLRVHGLDLLLKSYLGVRDAVDGARAGGAGPAATTTTTPTSTTTRKVDPR